MLLPKGQHEVQPYQPNPDEHDTSWRDPAWGEYKQRDCVLDMPVMVSMESEFLFSGAGRKCVQGARVTALVQAGHCNCRHVAAAMLCWQVDSADVGAAAA